MSKRIFSGIKPSGESTLGTTPAATGIRAHAGRRGRPSSASWTCTRSRSSTTPSELHRLTLHIAAMLFATGIDPALDGVRAEPRRARRGGLAARARPRASGELRRMTQFKEKSDQQEFVSSGALSVPGADGRRHPPVPNRHRSDRRRPAAAPRAHAATSRSASTPATAARSTIPDRRLPGNRRSDHGPPGSGGKQGKTGSTDQGTVLIMDPPDAVSAQVQDSGHRLGPRHRSPRDDKAGNLEPDRDHDRRDRGSLSGSGGALRRPGLRRVQGGGRPRRSSSCSGRSRSQVHGDPRRRARS